jgi:hypothetical protein
MNRIYLLITAFCCLLLFCTVTSAQVFTGGTTNISYDGGSVCVDLAPEVGYKIDRFRAGISPFILYKEVADIDNVTFGARTFVQYDIMKDVFVHAECQATRVQSITYALAGDIKSSKWVISFPVGAGYRYKIADKTYAYGSILYDFFLDENSPQKNPLIRGGITYDF